MTEKTTYIETENNEEGLPTHGFTVPSNYFDGLKSQILFQTVKKDAVKSGFEVPDGYFNQLKVATLAQTTKNNQPYLSLFATSPVFKFAAAAIFIASLGIVLKPALNTSNSDLTAQHAPISSDEIINYMSQTGTNDIPISEISTVAFHPTLEVTPNSEEDYIINQSDEHLIIDVL